MTDPPDVDALEPRDGETHAELVARLRAWAKAYKKRQREQGIRDGRRSPRTQREMRMFLDGINTRLHDHDQPQGDTTP
ncbi:hypothetical protein LO772_16555 [Yinghuangia sp. ASG 101]|uniref:hypothetical protein n=1 Tax=Yinghuangia sp. ASG 101 TaxID=2896848 RepID=UPI001E5F9025|nr:hypothetical protein [Yinghuangia sp. ASG 101]UGQ15029.1 hypothetical protein LO772_16555 [Yinghuangia sp. ASG 101]